MACIAYTKEAYKPLFSYSNRDLSTICFYFTGLQAILILTWCNPRKLFKAPLEGSKRIKAAFVCNGGYCKLA